MSPTRTKPAARDARNRAAPAADSFAAALERRAGLRQVRFAVKAADYAYIARAKRRYGAAAVSELVASLFRSLEDLRGAAEKN